MKNFFTRIINFFWTDIWSLPVGGDWRAQRKKETVWLKTMMVAGRHFIRKNLFVRDVPALTFSTLMAMIPVLALIFAIAKWIGVNLDAEGWIMDSFDAQPQVAETIVTFVNNYLEHTKSSYIVSTGVLMMLYTVFSLMQKIERSFNKIWHTKKGRSLWRMFTDYTLIFLFIVVMILISSTMSIVLTTMADTLDEMLQLGSLARRSLSGIPYVALALLFFVLYKIVPSTRVRWRCTIVPAILSGVLMAVLQFYYFKLQIGLASYNVIYGSFAALPLFLLWLEFSWAICLYGVELCYAIQNLNKFDYNMDVYDLSHEQHMVACAVVMKAVCSHYEDDQRCYTSSEIQKATALPQQLVDYSLMRLEEILLLRTYRDKHGHLRYTPSIDIYRLSVGLLMQRMEEYGVWRDTQHVIHLDSDGWQRVKDIKARFIGECDAILLKDL